MSTDMDKKQHLKDLITRRSSAKGQITKFRNYLCSISNLEDLTNIQLTELNLKLAKFEALSIRVDDLQGEIEVLCPDNMANEIDERDNIEREIIVNIAKAKTLLEKFNKKLECENRRASVIENSMNLDNQEMSMRLPQIQIARFDGAYFRWLEFRDTFENLIHNNTRILPIHKFHYLISYLEGDASRIISNLEVSSANYAEAWKLLCSRFNNKRILINHHLNSLFNIKPLSRESERSLRFLVDHVTKNLRALHSLDQPTDKWDVLVIFMLSSKLDSATLAKWEEYRSSLDSDTATLEQFNKFMVNRADVLESLNRNKAHEGIINASRGHLANSRGSLISNHNKQFTHTKSFATYNSSKQTKSNNSNSFICIICDNNHKIYDCPTFKAMAIDERLKNVSKYKLCANCLRQGHPVSQCRMGPCRDCNKRHNSLLHNPASSDSHHVSFDAETPEETYKKNEAAAYFSQHYSNEILLSTAVVLAANPLTQQKVKVRALLDCGSQSSFISKSLKERIALKSISIDSLKVVGIGNASCTNVVESCSVHIQSLNSNFSVISSCLILDELTGNIPRQSIGTKTIKLPKNIVLADPQFYKPAPIDLLIGADLFWDILGNEQVSLGPLNPKLRSSQLGWIISGPIHLDLINKGTRCNHVTISKSNSHDNIDKLLTKFWAIEEVPTKCLLSNKDKECERHFVAHTRRNVSGRFCVKLPLLESPNCLGDSYNLAKRRLLSLEKRFKRNPILKQEYSNFIMEYKLLGHLSPATDSPSNCYYLCHHAVLKQESESTKLRVVFDGSAPSSSGFALNDILMVGPNIQESLFSILIRARQYQFLLTGDIEKMYRQVLVAEEDRDLQRILWRDDESQPIQMYKLNTTTYGTASASYLSTRCLWQLGEEQDDELIKTIIQNDFFVDDLITGADTEERLRYIQRSVAKALESGCFNLRKYKCNLPSIFQSIEINNTSNLTVSQSSSTLGLGWSPSSDTLFFPIKNFTNDPNTTITKRLILSKAFKIFDPLGILSPVVIKPKILLQTLWQQKLDWDQPVTVEIKNEWLKLSEDLNSIKDLEVSRLVLCKSPISIELHSFSDASQRAYGACIYLKSTSSQGETMIRLLCAKSKVAPLKPTTIPRLELCAALLSVKLCKSVLDSIRYRPDKVIHWCDSSVVLSWINGDLTKLKLFVANRVAEILDLSQPSCWRYVPTHSNPADLISRGVDAKGLGSLSLWWSGPDYLNKNDSEWPNLKPDPVAELPEIKSSVTHSICCVLWLSASHSLWNITYYLTRNL
ncbi:unnamed protein product [Euphydryas editha]|uniref:Peptidase aspartic putative domain-containing protein n=1 Tax=Euphydryas editha TaxID=104508 RepID=A0AAU9UI65_EUPED|nr:unnamed protein product [Euphydryas editha]